ncbi:MAG TPA: hypothetical protein VGM01_01945 [Ktedonobacteraceae bacterium]
MQLELLSQLGSRLTILGKENVAAPLLEQALALARQLGEKRAEITTLLNLATAQQYLGNATWHNTCFKKRYTKPEPLSSVRKKISFCITRAAVSWNKGNSKRHTPVLNRH